MVSKFKIEDINEIEQIGLSINPKFKDIFKIDNLSDIEEIYVYKKDEEVFGFLHILKTIDKVEIINLAVKESKRKQKIASIILDYFLSEVSQPIILEVRESNTPAINLYKKFNFFVINIRKNYYGNENAVIMERSNK
ncbi:MAG: GNAT family N-acetyltransferase [Bacilli bacterium]|nr:GNAT family N-acetyltransferase [Bacilli bacterium]